MLVDTACEAPDVCDAFDIMPSIIGWSNNMFNNLHVRFSLETI